MLDPIKDIQSYTFWKVFGVILSIVVSFLLYVIKLVLDKWIDFNDLKEQLDKIYEHVVKESSEYKMSHLVGPEELRSFLYELLKGAKDRKFMDE